MTEKEWLVGEDDKAIKLALSAGAMSDADFHLFMLFCAKTVMHLVKDLRLTEVLRVKELWIHGMVTSGGVWKVRRAAREALEETDKGRQKWHVEAGQKETEAIWGSWAVWGAAKSVVCASSTDMYPVAKAEEASVWAARAIAWEHMAANTKTAMEEQVKWLRENVKPRWR